MSGTAKAICHGSKWSQVDPPKTQCLGCGKKSDGTPVFCPHCGSKLIYSK